MSATRTTVRRRLAALALAATSALAVVAWTAGAGTTDAAWTHRENARLQGAPQWNSAYLDIVAGSARSSDKATNANNMTYNATYRFGGGTYGTTKVPITNKLTSTTASPGSYSFGWEDFRRGPGLLDDTNSGSNPQGYNTLQPSPTALDPVGNALHNAAAYPQFSDQSTSVSPRNLRCMVGSDDFRPSTTNDSRCGLGQGNLAAATNSTSYGFVMGGSGTDFTYLNAGGVKTAVRCGPNGAVADTPTGRVDLTDGTTPSAPKPVYSSANSTTRTIWANGTGYGRDSHGFAAGDPASGTLSSAWKVSDSASMRAMPIITTQASASGQQPHALSEVALYVERYKGSALELKMYFVLSRAECGVRRAGRDSALPPKTPIFPASMPGGNSLTSYTGSGYRPAAQVAMSPRSRALGGGTPSPGTPDATTPATSAASAPAETGSVETTRPEPTPAGAATTASTTPSAPPADTTPAEAATPSSPTPTAEVTPPGPITEETATTRCGTATSPDGDVPVVVIGTECPADAPDGIDVLNASAAGTPAPPGWIIRTADDPAAQGWARAAVSRRTGTTLYIR